MTCLAPKEPSRPRIALRRFGVFFVQSAFIFFFALLSPIYYLNRWDFKRGTRRNPFYTSRLVLLLERFPILYELAMFVQNFPIPHKVYGILPEFSGDVLQVGCGTGLLNRHMRGRRDVRFTNLDPNGHALRLGLLLRRYSSNIQGFIDKELPLPDESFDVILFARSFHHVRHHRKAFQQCARLLRKGGRLIIADPVVLKPLAGGSSTKGYMANSSIDGVIWRFTQDSFERHLKSCLPSSLTISSIICGRQLHVTNYNLFVPQTDLIAVIEKKHIIERRPPVQYPRK